MAEAEPVVPIQARWARVMAAVKPIAKTEPSRGGGVNYSYRGIDPMLDVIGPIMRDHGVFMVPRIESVEYEVVSQTSSGNPMEECRVVVAYVLHDAGGQSLSLGSSAGQGRDSSDKATAKAMTAAWKSLLTQVLAIPTGDPDPDSERPGDGETHRAPSAPPTSGDNPDVIARNLGWRGITEMDSAWQGRLDQMNTLGSMNADRHAEVMKWLQENGLKKSTFTPAVNAEWGTMIAERMADAELVGQPYPYPESDEPF